MGAKSRRWLNQSTHSRVAYSTSSRPFHGAQPFAGRFDHSQEHCDATLGAGYWQADRLVMALALVWLAHIGLDRLLGMGLSRFSRRGTTARRRACAGSVRR